MTKRETCKTVDCSMLPGPRGYCAACERRRGGSRGVVDTGGGRDLATGRGDTAEEIAGQIVLGENDGTVDIDRVVAVDASGLTIDADDYCKVAAEVGVCERTVQRWASGETQPSRLARKALKAAGLL